MFNWFSLDFVYYPVSGIMWLWYKLFGLILGPTNFFAWGLAVMFLVFSLRALLYKPFVRQIRTMPDLKNLRIVMASGVDMTEECLAAGANAFLLKPYMPDELFKLLKSQRTGPL